MRASPLPWQSQELPAQQTYALQHVFPSFKVLKICILGLCIQHVLNSSLTGGGQGYDRERYLQQRSHAIPSHRMSPAAFLLAPLVQVLVKLIPQVPSSGHFIPPPSKHPVSLHLVTFGLKRITWHSYNSRISLRHPGQV